MLDAWARPVEPHQPEPTNIGVSHERNTVPARLNAEDRAFMLYVARKDYEHGDSCVEEYQEVLNRCLSQPSLFSLALRRARRIFTWHAEPKTRTPGTVAASGHACEAAYQAAGCGTLDCPCRPRPRQSDGASSPAAALSSRLIAACRRTQNRGTCHLGQRVLARRRMLCSHIPGRDSRPHRPPGYPARAECDHVRALPLLPRPSAPGRFLAVGRYDEP